MATLCRKREMSRLCYRYPLVSGGVSWRQNIAYALTRERSWLVYISRLFFSGQDERNAHFSECVSTLTVFDYTFGPILLSDCISCLLLLFVKNR